VGKSKLFFCFVGNCWSECDDVGVIEYGVLAPDELGVDVSDGGCCCSDDGILFSFFPDILLNMSRKCALTDGLDDDRRFAIDAHLEVYSCFFSHNSLLCILGMDEFRFDNPWRFKELLLRIRGIFYAPVCSIAR